MTRNLTDTRIVRVVGRLNLETVHGFISTIRSEPASYLAIEMCGVSFLDSAGMGALVDLFVIGSYTSLTQVGGQVRL